MKWRIRLFAVAAILSTSAALAATPEAEQRYEAAFQAMMADVGNLDKTFEYAVAAAEVEDFEGAIAALERMLLLRPDLPRVQLELAALYFRLGSYQQARNYLMMVKERKDVPSDVMARVDDYLGEIDKRVSVHKFSGTIMMGVRYDTNPNSASPVQESIFGTGVETQGLSSRKDYNAYTVAMLNHVYDFQDQAGTVWESDAVYYGARYDNEKQLNLNYLNLGSGPRFGLLPDVLDSASIRPYALYTHITMGGDPYGWSPGTGLNVRTKAGDATSLDLTAEVRRRHFHVSAARPTAADQQGWERVAKLQAQHALTDSWTLLAGTNWTSITAMEGYHDSREVGVTGGAAYSYSPFDVKSPWTTSASLTRAYIQYEIPDPLVNAGSTRLDRDWRFNLSTVAPVSDDWAVMLSFGRTIRSSNILNYHYDNTSGSVAAMWRF
ncbi:MAG TPA: tetratricopeptide repeat protein [Candidatus Omnitrophota bacterium]|nr:tetratricopeptide repeat protein [Candidatus Omnitrophota bacterium]